MNKPKDVCEVRLSKKDVIEAIKMYMNKDKFNKDIVVLDARTSQSKNYILIAEFK